MFLVKGRINKRNCSFRIDTGSDVTLVRKGLLGYPKQRAFRSKSFNLKYLTERVPVKLKVRALEVGELSIKLKDDYLLGSDFLSATNFEEN